MRKMGMRWCGNSWINDLKKMERVGERSGRNIGIDEFGKRKGDRYGSVMVEDERGEILEVIECRDCWIVGNVLKE